LPESQSEVVSLLSVCTIYILHVIKLMYIYNIYKGLCQSRLSTTNHALLLIAPATTAVKGFHVSLASLYSPGTDSTENVSSVITCSLAPRDTKCPQSCSLAAAVVLSPVYTAVT
jgi:hypothetical protein